MEETIQLDQSHSQLELFGPADSHLRLLRRSLGVRITARESALTITGKEKDVGRAADIVHRMQRHLTEHHSLTPADVAGFIDGGRSSDALEQSSSVLVYAQKKVIEPSTSGQAKYIRAMLSRDLTFCTGPAGTGKTYLAVAVAVSMLKNRQIRRIVLARPAVEAGEKLGFLPATCRQK